MLTSMFTRISHEEREIVVAKELEGLNTIAAENELQEEMVEKRPVGRPKKGTMLIAPSTIKQEEDTRKKKHSTFTKAESNIQQVVFKRFFFHQFNKL